MTFLQILPVFHKMSVGVKKKNPDKREGIDLCGLWVGSKLKFPVTEWTFPASLVLQQRTDLQNAALGNEEPGRNNMSSAVRREDRWRMLIYSESISLYICAWRTMMIP